MRKNDKISDLCKKMDVRDLNSAGASASLCEHELWFNGHLRIKHYFGTSPNAVTTQIWIAVGVSLMGAIIHKQLKPPGTFLRALQVLSIHPLEKDSLHQLLIESDNRSFNSLDTNQLTLIDL